MADEKRIFICAGEASGDRYGAKLAERLRALEPGIRLTGLGGPRMSAAGVNCHIDLTQHAAMGFVTVIRKLGTFKRLLDETDRLLEQDRPNVVVLIDNPGFNLRVAASAKKRGVKVVYYVSPQVWAWRSSRIKKIAAFVDKMLVILPFETELYRAWHVDCEYVGHPMLDYLSEAPLDERKLQDLASGEGQLVGLLPGSREQEVSRVFPLIARAAAQVARNVPGVRLAVACASQSHVESAKASMAQAAITGGVYHDRTFEIMRSSRICIAVSGTATLELCYFGTPTVIVYRAPAYARPFRPMIKTKYIGLPNIIAGTEIMPEFLLFRPAHVPIARAAAELLTNPQRWQECRRGLQDVMAKLGPPGASERAAKAILGLIADCEV